MSDAIKTGQGDIKINRSQVKEIIRRGAPNYRGNKVIVKTLPDGPYLFDPFDNFWSSGYRSYYTKIDLTNLKPLVIPDRNPMAGLKQTFDVPRHFIVVQHSYSGTKQSCTIWARQEDQGFDVPAHPVMFVKTQVGV